MDFSDQALSTLPALMFVVFYFLKLCFAARPTPPVIFSVDGHEILDRTKPVKLGSDLKLYCTSQGGDPAPSISWRRGGVPVPAHGQDVDNISGRVRSTVIISYLKASDQGAKVTCTADNSALIQPQTTSITLDVIGKIFEKYFIVFLVISLVMFSDLKIENMRSVYLSILKPHLKWPLLEIS